MLQRPIQSGMLLIALFSLLAGCAPAHTHSYVEEGRQDPTCTEEGFIEYVCSCGERYRESLAPLGHDYDAAGMCSVCGAGGSPDLTYALSEQGDFYTVTGPDHYTGTRLAISARHAGLPVLDVGANAFSYSWDVTEIVLAEGIAELGNDAFAYCTGAKTVQLPDGLTRIGSDAFLSCSNLETVTLGQGLTRIDAYAFAYCIVLSDPVLPAGLTQVGSFAFYQCWALEQMVLPDGVLEIGDLAFAGCRSLVSVFLPDSVTKLGDYLFSECPSLTEVRYGGTEADWNALGAKLPSGVRLICQTDG